MMQMVRAFAEFERSMLRATIDRFIDHIGIGSDDDSIGLKLPAGLEHIGMTPKLIAALGKRGFSPTDIGKIMGENFLRVMQQVERKRNG